MLSKKSLHRIESLHCVRKQSTIIHRNEEDYVNVHNVVISKDCSILFSFFQQCIVCAHPWYKTLQTDNIELGDYRMMIASKGKYIKKYNMTIPSELATYE